MYQQHYGYTLLDDLHNFYPEILYGDPGQWQNVPQLIRYIQNQTMNRFNLYHRGGRQWTESQNRERALAELMEPRVQTTVLPPVQPVQETVTPQRRVRPRPIPTAPVRIPRPSVRIPPPGNSPAYLSENEDEEAETTHVAASLINTIQNMITQDPLTATVQSMLDLGAGPRRVAQFTVPHNFLYTNIVSNEDIPIVPTQNEISRATRVYNATTADTSAEDVCAICQDNYTDGQPIRRIMHCDHKFHKSCIDTWFGRNTHCPVCRHDIRENT